MENTSDFKILNKNVENEVNFSCFLCGSAEDCYHEVQELSYNYKSKLLKFSEMLDFCLQIQMWDYKNQTNNKVCRVCWTKLIDFYEFKDKILNNQKFIMKFNETTINFTNSNRHQSLEMVKKCVENFLSKFQSNHQIKIIEGNETFLLKANYNEILDENQMEVKVEDDLIEAEIKEEPIDFPSSSPEYVNEFATEIVVEKKPKRPQKVKGYRCSYCNKQYQYQSNVLNHEKICANWNSKLSCCSNCSETFKSVPELSSHIENTENCRIQNDYLFQCWNCKQKFSKDSMLERHLSKDSCIHKKDTIKCNTCDMAFTSEGFLKRHLEKNKCRKTNQCPECLELFKSVKDLKVHCRSCCLETCGLFTEKELLRFRKYPFCKFCKLAFIKSNMWLYKSHKDQHTAFQFLLEKNCIHFNECWKCQKVFVKPEELEDHNENCSASDVTNGKIFCNYCTDKFTSSSEIKEHVTFKHLDSFQCPHKSCNFTTTLYRHFYFHLQKSHPGFIENITSYPCDYCDMTFETFYLLERHRFGNTCTGKTFQCTHCDRRFGTLVLLKTHLREIAKPYVCDICGKLVSNTTKLKDHMLIHTDNRKFKCNVCGASFKSKKQLNNHFTGHSSEKSFKCDQCNFYASSLRKVSDHKKRAHSGSVMCGICSRIFSNKRNLRNHLNDTHCLSKEETTKFVRSAKYIQQTNNAMQI